MLSRQSASLSVLLTCFVLFGSGCGTALSNAQFAGTSYPQTRSEDQIEELFEVPADYERLGRVVASCTEASGDLRWTDVVFADVTCSDRSLTQRLRRKAAEAGGTAVTDYHCDQDTHSKTQSDRTVTRTKRRCTAIVVRPRPQIAKAEPEPNPQPSSN